MICPKHKIAKVYSSFEKAWICEECIVYDNKTRPSAILNSIEVPRY